MAVRKLKIARLVHDKNKKSTLRKKLSRVSTRSVLGVVTVVALSVLTVTAAEDSVVQRLAAGESR